MDWRTYIHCDPEALVGKPVVRGTRLSAEFLLGLFAAGWTQAQVLESYPQLTAESLQAVFAYATDVVRDESMHQMRRGLSGPSLLADPTTQLDGWFTVIEREHARQRPLPR